MKNSTTAAVLPQRLGPRPRTTDWAPHIQEDQNAPQEMQAVLAAKVFALPDVEDRPTTLSDPGARAIWLKDSVPASPNDAFLGHREISHFHPWDGSLHIVLPPELVREVVAAGWAEVHPVARAGAVPPNRVILYGPRDGQELEVIFGLMDQFADGVTFVDLAPIRAPDLVLSTMARVLGLRDSGPQPLLERLREYLRDRDMLLILDNFEQVLPAAGHLADLLAAAPGLRMLVTSRVPLRLRSEQILRIYPLPVPEPDTVVPVDQLVQIPSVALFVERAQESLLSEREQEVLRLMAEGLTSKVIGQQIFLSHRTVDHHLTSIFNKLGVDTRAQAVAVAAREGPL